MRRVWSSHHRFWGRQHQGQDCFKPHLWVTSEAKVGVSSSCLRCLTDVGRSTGEGPTDKTVVDMHAPCASGQDIRTFTAELKRRSTQILPTEGLVFVVPPTVDISVPKLPTMNQNDPDLHRLSLTSDALANFPVSEYERWLLEVKGKTAIRKGQGGGLDSFLCDLEGQFQELQRRKIEEWSRQRAGLRLRGRLKSLSNSFAKSLGWTLVETSVYPWLFA